MYISPSQEKQDTERRSLDKEMNFVHMEKSSIAGRVGMELKHIQPEQGNFSKPKSFQHSFQEGQQNLCK